MSDFGIYVHIPFCEQKCKYCSFVSSKQPENIKKNYFLALKNEILSKKTQIIVSSIYFGGGTPSAVDHNFITKTLQTIRQNFNVAKDAEVTIECNPNCVDFEKLKAYKQAGFNRISFGAQSFDDETLKILGRTHNSEQIFQALRLARRAGFENISIDLILGVKKFENLEENIQKIKNLGVKHISAYMLILEENTRLFCEVEANKTKVLNDDESVEEYEKALKIFEKLGFFRYEISNFAQKNYQSRHNKNYWRCGEYFGFGLGAHSYFDGKRSFNTSNLNQYLSGNFFGGSEVLTQNQKIEEYIMLSLRTVEGLSLEYLKNLGVDLLQKKTTQIKFLQDLDAIKIEKNHIKITPKYFGVLNQIIVKLI